MTGGTLSPRSTLAASSRAMALLRNRKFADSPLEGTGFEPSVPREGNSRHNRISVRPQGSARCEVPEGLNPLPPPPGLLKECIP